MPPPVRFPLKVKASSLALSLNETVPVRTSSAVVKVLVPKNETLPPDWTVTFSQFVIAEAVKAWVPVTNSNSSTDCVFPESLPPSSTVEAFNVPPESVNVSFPAPNRTSPLTCVPV